MKKNNNYVIYVGLIILIIVLGVNIYIERYIANPRTDRLLQYKIYGSAGELCDNIDRYYDIYYNGKVESYSDNGKVKSISYIDSGKLKSLIRYIKTSNFESIDSRVFTNDKTDGYSSYIIINLDKEYKCGGYNVEEKIYTDLEEEIIKYVNSTEEIKDIQNKIKNDCEKHPDQYNDL